MPPSANNRNENPVIGTARVFISYSRKDGEEFAQELRVFLETNHIPLWQDRVGMEGGRDWWLQITEALDKVDFMILVMTPKAMESPIIRKEWRYARQKGVCVYPVKGVADDILVYDCLPRWLRSTHFYDLEYEREKFINDLNTRCLEPRVPFMADDLPEKFVHRPKEFNTLKEQLLDVERDEPLAITTSIRGAGGYGKTTLAMALCHDERVQDAYDDGILWVTLGEKPGDLTEKIKDLIEILSGKRPGFTDEGAAATYLAELLADRDILIVIDDVWNSEHVKPFLRGGPRCSRLITTRNSDTLPTRCRQNILDAMQSDEAFRLIGYELPLSEIEELHNLSEQLGKWPLVLKMVNAFLIERVERRSQSLSGAIHYVIKKLKKQGITAFDTRNFEIRSQVRSQAVESTISVSLELLSQEEKDRFNELAIFPEDSLIPLETVENLWMHAGFDDLDTEDLCEMLFRLSLLLHFDPHSRTIRLHDVIRYYLRKKNEHQLPRMHAGFLDSYGVEQWADLPITEPYLWNHLAYHLVDGDERNGLKNLLFDYNWLKGKLAASDVNVLLSDYDYLSDDQELSLVQQTLRLSSHQLTRDPNQLTPHLINRLTDINTPNIKRLLDDACESQKGTWFNPICCSLTPPGGSLVRTLEGHSDWSIAAVAISPDGQTTLSGSWDMTLKLWDLSSGKELHTFEGHSDGVLAVAISPNGQTALSGSRDKTLKLWDLSNGRALHTFEGHSDGVLAVAISPDGQTALSGSRDKTLKLWDLSSGKVLLNLNNTSGVVTAVAISPDGETAISGSSNKILTVWDLKSGKKLNNLEGHSGAVNTVAISADGQTALSGSSDETLKVWDLNRYKTLSTLVGHKDWINAVAITPDGRAAVSGSDDKTIKVWDLISGQELYTFEDHSGVVTTVAIGSDGKIAVSGSSDQTLKIWDLTRDRTLPTRQSHKYKVSSMAINSDDKIAVSGSIDRTLKVWDLSSGRALHTLEGHSGVVNAVAISPDGQTAVSGSDDKTIKVWDLSKGKEFYTLVGHSGVVNAVAINPDGRTVISGSFDKTLKVWDLSSGRELFTLEGHSGVVTAVAISPDGKTAISSSWDSTLRIWNLSNGYTLHTLEGHSDKVYAMAMSLNDQTAVSGSNDETLKVWDISTGQELYTFEGHNAVVSTVAISLDGKTALSGSWDNTLRLWDLLSGKEMQVLEGHSDRVYAVAISPDGKTAVSGSYDNTVRLWDLSNGEQRASFVGDSGIGCLALSSAGTFVLAGEERGYIHFLRLEGVAQ